MDFTELSADLKSYPITGYLYTGERLDVPLISHIQDNLYVGGCMHGIDLGDFFSDVFSMYKWERYRVAEGTNFVEVTMYDSHDVDVEAVEKYSTAVAEALERGGNVLVHCQAGINRSNLIASIAMVKRYGITPSMAITALSDARSPLILSNTTFRNFVLNYEV